MLDPKETKVKTQLCPSAAASFSSFSEAQSPFLIMQFSLFF